MPNEHHILTGKVPAILSSALAGALIAIACPASAEDGLPYRARIPIPQAILTLDTEMGEMPPVLADPGTDDDAVMFEADLTGAAMRSAAETARTRARLAIPIDVVRKGLSVSASTTGPQPERAVGFRLGEDALSVTTRIVAAPGDSRRRDARIDWRLARPLESGPGFIWTVATEGGSGLAAPATQNASVMLGYRHQIMEHLTVTSQVAMGGSYVFVPNAQVQTELVPEVTMSADLGRIAKLPLDAALDVTLARKMPLVPSAYETRGSAMLRLKYRLD